MKYNVWVWTQRATLMKMEDKEGLMKSPASGDRRGGERRWREDKEGQKIDPHLAIGGIKKRWSEE